MAQTVTIDVEAFRRFVDEYRARCLWFLRPEYYPGNAAECAEVLRLIERYGDRAALGRAAAFRQWLSHRSSETSAADGSGMLLVEWVRDSAFRFFPLVEHDELGLTLHPFDLATNKVLALVGRLEVRDWVDVLLCDERVQPLGYLAWAACGKDPGFTPQGLLDHARRSSRYSADEVAALAFAGPPPDAGQLSAEWREALERADAVVSRLPPARAGEAVLTIDGGLLRAQATDLERALSSNDVRFHAGRLGGAWPDVRAIER